ncbi:phosphatidylserine decarboxylase-domain-containing protein [Gautieria morchelliformis]|nr:phosphatidylserine decarboxylase-domain-containing protein [Gautieria morchelliformis]
MSSLPASNKVEVVHLDNLPNASHDHLLGALHKLVGETNVVDGGTHDISKTIHTPIHTVPSHPWLGKFIPGLENLAAEYHVGNFVVIRATGEQIFESMPIYARIGMHLLFYGKVETVLLRNKIIEAQLKEQSIKEGIVFDSPSSVSSIPSFIETYKLSVDELLITDIKSGYKCFNEFFYRKLKPDARPVENADNPSGFCSAADCRITVFENMVDACEFWVKGRNFTLPNLLASSAPHLPGTAIPDVSVFENGSLAIHRLAPADYHRFHSPADVIVGDVVGVDGQYYTVNPQAVNEPGFDVFTANRRAILYLTHERTGQPIAFVAIGALLVGSIIWTVQKGDKVKRGQELGYFAYGGSTIINVFPKGLIKYDNDLIVTSKKALETLVKVGSSLGVQQE